MSWQITHYAIALAAAAVVVAGIAALVWQRRAMPGGLSLALMLWAVAGWSLCNAFEAAATSIPIRILCNKLSYVGVASAPVLFFTFALQFAQREAWLTGRRKALLWAIPLLTVALSATNDWHGLMWSGYTTTSSLDGSLIDYENGPWFWVLVVYLYALLIAATGVVAWAVLRLRERYRSQALVLLAAVPLPYLCNALFVLGVGPFKGYDLTPIALALSGMILALGIYRLQLFDLIPVARDTLVESMADGVLLLDGQDRILDINPAARRILGAPTAAVIGQDVMSALPGWGALTAGSGALDEGSVEILMADGQSRWLDVRVSALERRALFDTGRLITLRDVTAAKLTEAEVQTMNGELAARLHELQARNEELDAFAHTVAHDLKNPLGQIMGYVELLASPEFALSPDEQRHSLLVLQRTATKMNEIVDGLLILSQVRDADVKVRRLDMAVLVKEALGRVEIQRQLAEGEIALTVDGEWPVALGQPLWVEEVWVNYIGNALKYGGRPPRIEVGGALQVDGMACFWVRDNGRGLTAAEQARLFLPFERISQCDRSGYGLGLSIVRRIVERLGGNVRVESQVGYGSTFFFTLPAAGEPTTGEVASGEHAGGRAGFADLNVSPLLSQPVA